MHLTCQSPRFWLPLFSHHSHLDMLHAFSASVCSCMRADAVSGSIAERWAVQTCQAATLANGLRTAPASVFLGLIAKAGPVSVANIQTTTKVCSALAKNFTILLSLSASSGDSCNLQALLLMLTYRSKRVGCEFQVVQSGGPAIPSAPFVAQTPAAVTPTNPVSSSVSSPVSGSVSSPVSGQSPQPAAAPAPAATPSSTAASPASGTSPTPMPSSAPSAGYELCARHCREDVGDDAP